MTGRRRGSDQGLSRNAADVGDRQGTAGDWSSPGQYSVTLRHYEADSKQLPSVFDPLVAHTGHPGLQMATSGLSWQI
jgi:hypothetical protein